jgi:hypothetical protein
MLPRPQGSSPAAQTARGQGFSWILKICSFWFWLNQVGAYPKISNQLWQ